MKKRFTFRTVMVVAAAAVLLLSPLFALGQGDKEITFEFKLVDEDDQDFDPYPNRYAYEFRVRVGKAGTDPRYVGAYRAWKTADDYPDAAENREEPRKFFPEVSPILCSAGEEVFIDWYDHVMTSAHFAGQSWNIYYPKVGKVTIKNKDNVSYSGYSDERFFGPVGTGALKAEVRIPWQHVQDVDAAIYTVLNNAGNNDNPSFTLPSDLEEGSNTVEVTLKMAKKEWKTLNFGQNTGGKTFDGSMRVRMKSPGDEHFMLNYLNGFMGGPQKLSTGPFYEAYPYPNTDHPGAMPLILEGTLMVVEARSWAADGVCVDNKYPARFVTLANPGDLNKINAASEGDDRQAYSGGYWLVPLWGESHTVTVRPEPCPGGNVTINCKDSRISLYTKDGVKVLDGSVVESNRKLFGRFTPNPNQAEDHCLKPPVVQWGVMPDRIQSVPIDATTGEFSFVPGGQEGETISVWIHSEKRMTELDYDDEIYLVEYYGAAKNDGEVVPCGSDVMVKVQGPSKVDGCVGKIRVDVGGASQFIEKVGGEWQPVQVKVEGEQAEFTFTPEKKKYTIHWTQGTGYSVKVEARESATQLKEIQIDGEVPCGDAVKITVTPGNGLKVQGLKAVYDDGTHEEATPVGSNTLEIASLSQGIQEIEVKVGTDPQVTVNENSHGVRVAKITVLNVTQGNDIWADGDFPGGDGVFANGDELEVSLEPMDGCVDWDKVEVKVTWNDDKAIEQTHRMTKADNTLNIPKAYDKVTVEVVKSEPKQFAVSWSEPNKFKVQQGGRDLTLGDLVACGSSIAIVPTLERCEQVKEVKVNGVTVSPSKDGKYLCEVKEKVTSIEVAVERKKINVKWAGVTDVRVEVNGATTPMPVEVDCGAELTVVFTPNAGDGAVQEVTIAEEGKGDVTLTHGSLPVGYTWEDNKPAAGQTTVKWHPEGNVTIKSVTLPEKYKVTYKAGSGYTVAVVEKGGTAVTSGSQVLGGAELTVKVTVADPAEWKVVKVNGDGNVTSGGNGVYTYTFTLKQDTEVKVELGKQMYRVSYVQSPDVKEMKVCEGRQNGSEIASGSEVEYGSAIYVYVAVEKKQGSAVQGVESVTVRYEGGGEVRLDVGKDPEDGWYILKKLEGEIVGIDVKVEKLEPGEVLIVYSKEAQGGEGEQPYGAKGIVTWKGKDEHLIAAGQKKKVKVSDPITWSLAAAPGVDDDSLLAVCLAANRGYAQRLEGTDRVKKYESLEKLLDLVEGLKDKVMAQEVTEVKLETYVTVKQNPKPLLVLTVRKPQLGDELKVIMPGAGGAWLEYDKSYRVSGDGKTEVTLKAEAKSPVVLKEIYVEGKERLGLTKEMESTYKLPPYDPASTNGNRLTFYAIFSQEGADNCLLTLQANPSEGGVVTALRKSNKEELSSGQQYQRELDVEVRVQANEGYYIKSVIQNGSELYGNVQSDTTKVMYSSSIKLPAKELLVQADFSPIPRGGKEGKTNAVESAALRGVEIYPNPTDGAIEVRGASGVARYAVYDVTGCEMLGGVHDGGAQLRIDLGMLASGFYIVQLRSADGGMRAEGVLRR